MGSKINNMKKNDVDREIEKEELKEPKIVAIGGGTGLSILLKGLKEYTSNITAIVTVADDGGGSGILREELGMLPPGDIRNCILALSDIEPAMEKVFQHRFKEGSLKNQNLGNLFIAAMNEIYGGFDLAIEEASNLLGVKGKVLPMTLENVTLYADLQNGDVVAGESNIPLKNKEVSSKIAKVYMEPKVSYPLKETVKAIEEADIIVLGPGSLYTSIIPNLLVNGIARYISKSNAIKAYIPNIMTQPGETDDYTVFNHVDAIFKHSREDLLDYVIVNVEGIPEETLRKYEEDGSKPVYFNKQDEEKLNNLNIKVIKGNLIEVKNNHIRHDNLKTGELISKLFS